MPEQVKVEDLEVFRLFRVAMLKFAQAAEEALSSADSEIARTHSWLEGEQATYWHGQFRKRTEAVTAAREALRQKKLYKDATGRTPNAVHEEKALAQCVAAVEQARQKIEAVRKSLPKLEKEAEVYRGGVSRLRGALTGDIPRAVALLDRLAATLEQYVLIEAPAVEMPQSAASATIEESMSRGGDIATDPAARADGTAPAATARSSEGGAASEPPAQSDTPAKKEGGDVTAGE